MRALSRCCCSVCCSGLVQQDWLSACDPIAALFSHDSTLADGKLIARTEWLRCVCAFDRLSVVAACHELSTLQPCGERALLLGDRAHCRLLLHPFVSVAVHVCLCFGVCRGTADPVFKQRLRLDWRRGAGQRVSLRVYDTDGDRLDDDDIMVRFVCVACCPVRSSL